MRMRTVLVAAMACLLFVQPADADVLQLSSGGSLKGTLEEVTILVGGKQVKELRAKIQDIYVSETAKDYVTFKDGKVLEGELVSVKFKSLGGSLPFGRTDFRGVILGDDEKGEFRKELAAKRAKIGQDDAKGLCELAQWCRGKGLRDESLELAKASLEASAGGKSAGRAHLLLGHVRYKSQWMTSAEAARRRKESGGAQQPAPDPPPAKTALTPGQLNALRASLATNKNLFSTYTARVKEIRTQERAGVDAKYNPQKERMLSTYRPLKERIDEQQAERDRRMRAYNSIYGRYTGTMRKYYERYRPTFNDNLVADKITARKLTRRMTRLAGVIKRARAGVNSRARQRKGRVTVMYDRHQRILWVRKINLSADRMTAAYEAALKLD